MKVCGKRSSRKPTSRHQPNYLALHDLLHQARPSLTLQESTDLISIVLHSLICNLKTAPVVVLHTEAKVLLLSQNEQ